MVIESKDRFVILTDRTSYVGSIEAGPNERWVMGCTKDHFSKQLLIIRGHYSGEKKTCFDRESSTRDKPQSTRPVISFRDVQRSGHPSLLEERSTVISKGPKGGSPAVRERLLY